MFMAMKRRVLELGGYALAAELTAMADAVIARVDDCAWMLGLIVWFPTAAQHSEFFVSQTPLYRR
jgi:hypothetical protein